MDTPSLVSVDRSTMDITFRDVIILYVKFITRQIEINLNLNT